MMKRELLISEISTKGIRSSGPGGQHVNKVASKVELLFDITASKALSDDEKKRLTQKLASRLTKQQVLILQCDESRSQHRNKEIIVKRFFALLQDALKEAKPRKDTKPSRAAVQKRLQKKKIQAIKKASRRKPDEI